MPRCFHQAYSFGVEIVCSLCVAWETAKIQAASFLFMQVHQVPTFRRMQIKLPWIIDMKKFRQEFVSWLRAHTVAEWQRRWFMYMTTFCRDRMTTYQRKCLGHIPAAKSASFAEIFKNTIADACEHENTSLIKHPGYWKLPYPETSRELWIQSLQTLIHHVKRLEFLIHLKFQNQWLSTYVQRQSFVLWMCT